MGLLPLLALALVSHTACERAEAGLHVVIDGPLQPGVDFDRLVLVAYLAADGTPLYQSTVEGPELALPFRFNLVSGPLTPAGTEVEVLASAEREGQLVSAARAKGTLSSGEGSLLELTLPATRADGGTDAGVVAGAELCDNGLDDDGDGRADCADPDCEAQSCLGGGLSCRSGVCGCASATVGRYVAPLVGFMPRKNAAAIVVEKGSRSGWLMVVGGEDLGGPTAAVEVYNPSSVQLETAALQTARGAPVLVSLADGRVTVLGGSAAELLSFQGPNLSSRVLALQPASSLYPAAATTWGGDIVAVEGDRVVALQPGVETNTAPWRQLATLSAVRSQGAWAGAQHWVLASGPLASASTDAVLPDGGVLAGPSLPFAVAGAAVASLPDGRALVAGGRKALADGGSEASAAAFVLLSRGGGLSLQEVSPLPQAMPSPRAQVLGNGWVYLEDPAGSAFWFDPAAERFVPAPPVPYQRTGEAWAGTQTAVFRVGGEGDGGLQGSGYFLELQCP